MKIMTLNLNFYESKHGEWSVRRDLIVATIEKHAPDIVALQAVRRDPAIEDGKDQAVQLADRLPDFNHVVFVAAAKHPDGRQDGSAFLSRVALDQVDHKVLSLAVNSHAPVQDHAPRIILRARLTSPALTIFNSHYSWVTSQALSNVKEALAYMGRFSGPALLVGDLNTPPNGEPMRQLAAAGWSDVWAHLRNNDLGYTFESNAPDKRIDYVWASRDALSSIKSIELVTEPANPAAARLSDHLGLLVTVL
jgi:endonuclease/exonuclease/phosphatase family metal-dependent hydrolase